MQKEENQFNFMVEFTKLDKFGAQIRMNMITKASHSKFVHYVHDLIEVLVQFDVFSKIKWWKRLMRRKHFNGCLRNDLIMFSTKWSKTASEPSTARYSQVQC